MATQAQIQANRRNAQLSTGPRTPEGKARSAANATTHGLTGRFRVLDTENQADFDELFEIHLAELAPATAYERFLVEQIAQAQWLVARAQRVEVKMIESMIVDRGCADADDMLAKAYRGSSARLLLSVQRQAGAYQRAAFRAMDQLRNLRRDAARDAAQHARQNEPNSRVTPLPPPTSPYLPLPPSAPSTSPCLPLPPSTPPTCPHTAHPAPDSGPDARPVPLPESR